LKGGNPGEGVAPLGDPSREIWGSVLAGICDCTGIALHVQSASLGKRTGWPGKRKPGLSPGIEAASRGKSTGKDDARAKATRCPGREADSPRILIARSLGPCCGRCEAHALA
jgi:hypothetical protein